MTADLPRIEGPVKVTGRWAFAADDVDPALAHAFVVGAPAGPGRIRRIDTEAAAAAPVVVAVVTRGNAPRLNRVLSLTGGELGDQLPLQDDRVRHAGQCVAIVVAETWEEARAAAALVAVEVDAGSAAVTLAGAHPVPAKRVGAGDPGQRRRGDPDRALAAAAHRVELEVETPAHHHNAIEPGAIVARWDADSGLTVRLPTQFAHGDAALLGQAFGFGPGEGPARIVGEIAGGWRWGGRVRVEGAPAGGAFGGKTGNVHLLLGAMAAKVAGRPVKLVLTRAQVFALMPYRAETRQRIALGADAGGRLAAIVHEPVAAKATAGRFVEPAGELTPHLYACPSLAVRTATAALDLNAPGWMRAPGNAVGVFALETAMDALAHVLRLDPIELRLRNHADRDPATGKRWSSKSLRACYDSGAAAIGWTGRDREVGATRDADGRLVGYGMATAAYPVRQLPAAARVTLGPDGVLVETAAHEIGQGMATAITTIAADALGVGRDLVRLRFGSSDLPFGGITAGSMTTLSVGAAVAEACGRAQARLLAQVAADRGSQLFGGAGLRIVDGRIEAADGASEAVERALVRLPCPIAVRATTGRTFGRSRHARMAWGAQFARVLVDPATGEVRVDRLVGAFAAGRIVSPTLARSQLIGGMVWGLGQALMEESVADKGGGRWLHPNLGEALVPTHADVPAVEAILVPEDDTAGHPSGIKGLGEIGVVGVAAAIGSAVFHATGRRPTQLPIRLETLA